MLGYNNINNVVNTINTSDENRSYYKDIMAIKYCYKRELYQVLTKSTKSIANLFMQKYLIEIIPELRKNPIIRDAGI